MIRLVGIVKAHVSWFDVIKSYYVAVRAVDARPLKRFHNLACDVVIGGKRYRGVVKIRRRRINVELGNVVDVPIGARAVIYIYADTRNLPMDIYLAR